MSGQQSEKSEQEITEIKRVLTGNGFGGDGGLVQEVRELRQILVGIDEDREGGLVQTVRRMDARIWLILVGVVLGPIAGILLSGLVGN